jgi:flagellar motor switch protein FliM
VSFQGDSFETDYGWLKRFSARLKEAPVTMSVCLGEKEISVEELMRFSSGDVIVLKQGTTQPLTATVEGVPKFIGSPGTTKGMQSFQIKDIILGRE